MAAHLEQGGISGVMQDGQTVTLGEQGLLHQRLVEQWVYGMRVLNLAHDERCRHLKHCQAFYDGSQHDHLGLTWNGVPRDPGVGYMWERLQPQGFVPVNSSMWIEARKPDAPVPLARQVISRFTELLLGEGRTPTIRCFSDPATQDYLDACFRESDMWDVLSEARDLAGSCGSAAIALGVSRGHLTGEVLNPADLWIPAWETDYPGWSPNYVVEQYTINKQRIDPETHELELTPHWRTRAWTPTEIIYYEDVPVEDAHETGIPIREKVEHGLGSCPVVWYQNTRSTRLPDGHPDCATAYPLLDKLDRLQSQVYKAAIANADPTLVIKENRAQRRGDNRLIQKGSNHVIALSNEGSADYLEMAGSSVGAGLEAIDKLVREILMTVECVVIDPEYARAYQSGEAMQLLWRSMESRANRLRTTLGAAIKEISYYFLKMAEVHGVANVETRGSSEETPGLLLPPRKVETTVPSELLQRVPKGPAMDSGPSELAAKPNYSWAPHEPGNANAYIELDWPSYWSPTPQQVMQMANAMGVATQGKPVISQESATRKVSQMLNIDPEEEVKLMDEEGEHQLGHLMNLGKVQNTLDEEDGEDAFDDEEEAPEEEDEKNKLLGKPKPKKKVTMTPLGKCSHPNPAECRIHGIKAQQRALQKKDKGKAP